MMNFRKWKILGKLIKEYNEIKNNVEPKVKKFIDENISKENVTSVHYSPNHDVLVNIRLLENKKENQEKDYNLIIEYLKDQLEYPNADVNLLYEQEIN